MTGSLLAFDVGTVRIGVARCERGSQIAIPVETIAVDCYNDDAFTRAIEIYEKYSPDTVIVGLPLLLSGKQGQAARMSSTFARRMAKRIAPVEVRLVDERYTSHSAKRRLDEAGRGKRDRKQVIDQVAATLILQHALESESVSGVKAGETVIVY